MLVYWLYNLNREFQLRVLYKLISSYNDVLYNAFKVIALFKRKILKKSRERTIIHSLFNPVLVFSFFFSFFLFFFFKLIADVSLFSLVKWSHYVPGVEMYSAFSADHSSLSSL